MSRISDTDAIRLPLHDETVSPVRILDAEGRLVRIVPVHELRGPQASGRVLRRRREIMKGKSPSIEADPAITPVG